MSPAPDAYGGGAAAPAGAADAYPLRAPPVRRRLLAFDFDHSIADANSDTFIIPSDSPLPRSLKSSYVAGRWTEYMQRVLTHLHGAAGLGAAGLRKAMSRLPLVEGMAPLLAALAAHRDTVDCIIISDSNSLFIDWALSAWGHGGTFARVFTNPAEVEAATGRLLLTPHDAGHGCGRCPLNMCKRVTLGRYLREKAAEGVEYDRIAYVGDGSNDLCPSAALLGPSDVVFARSGFALDKALAELEQSQAGSPDTAGADGCPAAGGGGGDATDCFGRRPGAAVGAAPPRAAVVRWGGGEDILGWLEAQGWWGPCGGAAGGTGASASNSGAASEGP